MLLLQGKLSTIFLVFPAGNPLKLPEVSVQESGEPVEKLFADAYAVRSRFLLAGRLCGAWIGLVIGLKLVSLSVRRHRKDYEADQTRCVACARCFRYCPEELKRLGLPVPEMPPPSP